MAAPNPNIAAKPNGLSPAFDIPIASGVKDANIVEMAMYATAVRLSVCWGGGG